MASSRSIVFACYYFAVVTSPTWHRRPTFRGNAKSQSIRGNNKSELLHLLIKSISSDWKRNEMGNWNLKTRAVVTFCVDLGSSEQRTVTSFKSRGNNILLLQVLDKTPFSSVTSPFHCVCVWEWPSVWSWTYYLFLKQFVCIPATLRFYLHPFSFQWFF